MNKNIFSKIALMAGVALMGVGCQTDYFNETYLPGYENGGAITDAKNFELVLSADDYAAIAKNNANKAIAEEEARRLLRLSLLSARTNTSLIRMRLLPTFLHGSRQAILPTMMALWPSSPTPWLSMSPRMCSL